MTRLGFLLAAMLLAPVAAFARPVDSYVAEQNGVRIEISAPRPDTIVRIRIGRPNLPENASWAVLKSARARRTPMEATEARSRARSATTSVGACGRTG